MIILLTTFVLAPSIAAATLFAIELMVNLCEGETKKAVKNARIILLLLTWPITLLPLIIYIAFFYKK